MGPTRADRSGTRRRGALLIALALAVSWAVTGGNAHAQSRGAAGALVQVSGKSPFTECKADAGQPGENNPDTEVEPWVAVNPRNPAQIVGSWQQDRWSDGASRGLVLGVSRDGGASWTPVVVPRITVCSGGTPLNGGYYRRASDPWLTFAPNGDLYHIALAADADPETGPLIGTGRNAMLVSKSRDGGSTWSDPVALVSEADPRRLNDKESITADPHDPSVVYAVWDRLEGPPGLAIEQFPENLPEVAFKGPVMFARTTSAGALWETPRVIYDPGDNRTTIGNQIVVTPDGTVVDFFSEFRRETGPARLLSLVRSRDRGATWSAPVPVSWMYFLGARDPQDADRRFRSGAGLFDVAVDPVTGILYAVWQGQQTRSARHDDVLFSRSTDGGTTWSEPVAVNQTPDDLAEGSRQAFTPSVAVAEDGTVGISYFDFRAARANSSVLATDAFLIRCRPSSDRTCTTRSAWSDEVRLTDESFNLREAPTRSLFLGDYQGLTASGGDFLAFFAMPHRGDRASVFFRRVSGSTASRASGAPTG